MEDVTLLEYRRAVRFHLKQDRLKEAYTLLLQAIVHYPENPYILSHFGYLQAAVEGKYRTGVENCRKAIGIMQQNAGREVPAELYLNLGKAYAAAGRRKEAVDTLERGIRYDSGNDLLNELRSIGIRRKPVIPFLNRSNPINKYIGMFLHKRKTMKPGEKKYSPRQGMN